MKEEIVDFYINKDYPFNIQMLGISYCDGTYRIERKNPEIYVFEYILEGEGTVVVDNTTYKPMKGDIYLLPRKKDHLYFSDAKNPWTKIWFNIYGTLVDNLIQAYNLNDIYYISNLDLETLFFKMLKITRETELNTNELFNKEALLFHEIIIRIADRINTSNRTQINLAQILKQYIDANVEKNLSINEMSKIIYKSTSQMIRLFKKEFNITPYEYLLTQKVEIAKLLLTNTNIEVKEIAYRLNFADEHYFSNYFKIKTGVSPIKFRNQK